MKTIQKGDQVSQWVDLASVLGNSEILSRTCVPSPQEKHCRNPPFLQHRSVRFFPSVSWVGAFSTLLHAIDRCRRRWMKCQQRAQDLCDTNISRILTAFTTNSYLVGEIMMAPTWFFFIASSNRSSLSPQLTSGMPTFSRYRQLPIDRVLSLVWLRTVEIQLYLDHGELIRPVHASTV